MPCSDDGIIFVLMRNCSRGMVPVEKEIILVGLERKLSSFKVSILSSLMLFMVSCVFCISSKEGRVSDGQVRMCWKFSMDVLHDGQ